MRSKKGLSTVVTTLIIVLLVLAAIGIIWGPIKNLLTNSTNSLSETSCLNLNIQATKVVSNGTNYTLTIKREDSSNIASAGVDLIFYNGTSNSATIDLEKSTSVSGSPSEFTSLQVQTVTVDANLVNATKVDVTPYYKDSTSGKTVICSTSQSYAISQ